MKISDLMNKRVLVAGLGVTGLSVVKYLIRSGVEFDIADERDAHQNIDAHDKNIQRHTQFSVELFCGFDIIVLSPGIARAHPAVASALQAGVVVIGDIELFADAVGVPVIAVTGSNGKSTVVAWLTEVINECGLNAIACGNIGEPALDALLGDAQVLVLELSSYQLESTSSLRPLAATVLNVSEDHLDRYDDIEHYAATKRRIYEHAEHCLANFDDMRTWPTPANNVACDFFTISSAELSSVNNGSTDSSDSEQSTVRWQRALVADASLAVPGEHNKSNALVVLALSSTLNLCTQQCIKALASFTGLAHRSQFVVEKSGVRWFNDSKGTNVDACEKAIVAMGSPVILIAGGMAKGADFTPLQATVKEHVKLLLLLGTDKQTIAADLQGSADIQIVETLREAIIAAHNQAVPGDAVLLSPACASFDMFNNFEHRGDQFVATVNEVLAA